MKTRIFLSWKEMQRFLLMLSFIFPISTVFSQTGLQNNGAKMSIPSGAYVKISGANGHYTNTTVSGEHGRLALEGSISLSGNWVNNASGGDLLDGTGGEVIFDGSSTQQISGSRTTNFVNVQLNEDVEILAPYQISANLDLSNGSLILGDNDLSIPSTATITNYGPGKYIRTGGDGALVVQVNAGASPTTYPVGTASSYMPLVLQQASGASSGNFEVRIIDGIWSNGESGTDYSLTDECVNKTWLIESSVSSIDLTMTMQWNASDEVNGFDRQNCYISHFENGQWDQQTRVNASGSGPFTVSRANVTSLSPFAVAGDNDGGALPIVLLDFSAKSQGFDALLDWHTATEHNNKGFEIYRSVNNKDFEKIGFVPGRGNSNTIQGYSFTDISPTHNENGTVYYKLRQIDFDGTYAFSQIKPVSFVGFPQTSYIIWPNPSSGNLNISVHGKSIKRICVYDLSGKIIYKQEEGNFNMLQLGFLSAGMYLLELYNGYTKYRERIVLE